MRNPPFAGHAFGRVLLVALAICLTAVPTVARDSNVVNGKLGRALDRAVQRSTAGGFWGAVIVARDDEILLAKGYGYADYESRPNTPRSLFEIASASKQFTAAGVLKLQMQGKLDVEDSVASYFEDVPDDKRSITVHQLLTHTSGISPSIGLPYSSPATRDELVQYVTSQPLAARPGTTYAYCNSGYALLAALIEVVSGESFESYMTREVFRPAGLEDTGFIKDDHLDARRATTRLSTRTPDATATDWFWSWGYRGMGGVVTTAHDLVAWDRALRGDTVLDAAAKAMLYAPALEGYACGWQVGTTDRGTTSLSHGGRVEGYGCQYVRFVDEGVVLAILSNGNSDVFAVQRALEERLFPKPTVTVTLDVARFDLDELQAVRATSEGWRVTRDAGRFVLTLPHSDDGKPMAIVDAPLPLASRLAADLERMLAGRADDGEAEPAVDAGVYFAGIGGRNQAMTLRGVELNVMPRYTGMDADGNRIVDERITLIVMDRQRGFWPVMAKMNLAASRRLLEGLREALE